MVTIVAGSDLTIPALRKPIKAMNKPIPALTAAYKAGGIAAMITCRIPAKVRIRNATPDRKTAPSAVSHVTPIPFTTV